MTDAERVNEKLRELRDRLWKAAPSPIRVQDQIDRQAIEGAILALTELDKRLAEVRTEASTLRYQTDLDRNLLASLGVDLMDFAERITLSAHDRDRAEALAKRITGRLGRSDQITDDPTVRRPITVI